MTTFSVADAKNKLPELIDRAISGEDVTITRHGTPVAEIRALHPAPRRVTQADLAWLQSRVYHPAQRVTQSAGALVSKMRDEDEA